MDSFVEDAKGRKVAVAKINETSRFLLQFSVDIQRSNAKCRQLISHNRPTYRTKVKLMSKWFNHTLVLKETIEGSPSAARE